MELLVGLDLVDGWKVVTTKIDYAINANNDGFRMWSDVFSDRIYYFSEIAAANVTNINGADGFTISPNPTSDILKIENKKSQILKVSLVNSIGKTVIEKTANVNVIDVSSLQKGCYIVIIKTATGNGVKKVIVN